MCDTEHQYITYVQRGEASSEAGKTDGEVCSNSVEWSEEVEVHQNPEVFPPGGILTLTELLAGEFLTWS